MTKNDASGQRLRMAVKTRFAALLSVLSTIPPNPSARPGSQRKLRGDRGETLSAMSLLL